jgi:hypothetical protein
MIHSYDTHLKQMSSITNAAAANASQDVVPRGHRSSATCDRLQRRLAKLRKAHVAPKTSPATSAATPEQMDELRRIVSVCQFLHPTLRYTN